MRVVRFSRGYVPAVIASTTIIILGLVGYATKGFNLGVDFQAGINQTVQLAYPVMDVSYSGKGNAVLTVSEQKATIVFSGAEVENRTVDFVFKDDPTLSSLAAAMGALPGLQATLRDPAAGSDASTLLVPTFQGDTNLSSTPAVLHRAPASNSELFATTEQVRASMSSMGRVSVQVLKPTSLQRFLIRVQDEGKDPDFSKTAPASITAGLEKTFGADRVVVMKTDYVGAAYSQTLSKQAFWLTFFTVLVILIYATIRFKFQYGIGAVLATVHDMLIMITFIVWTRMEFNATSIAAILTILGYSINDTIVQFDRVREDRRLKPNDKFVDVLNTALTETLSRTIITTLCTMITVIALFVFTTGSLKDFSLALFVGMVSGTYSTIFIASAFVLWWENLKEKRAAKEATAKVALAAAKKPQAPAAPKAEKKSPAKKE